MTNNDNALDDAFIAAQRERLEALRDQLTGRTADKKVARDTRETGVKDSGEQGASEAQRNRSLALNANARGQLADVRRALEKIDEGSYGYSDESDEPIQKARLQAVPEANLTVEEEAEREQRVSVEGRLNQ